MLSVERLSRSFGGVAALEALDLAVADGEVLGLIGPNGSGKTTLFNVITGVHAPDAGRVLLRGADISRSTPARIVRHGIARTFQNLRIYKRMSVRENVWVAQHSLPGVGPLELLSNRSAAERNAGSRSTGCSTPWASPTGGTCSPAACRSPTSGGWSLPARSCAPLRSCSWTSRRAA